MSPSRLPAVTRGLLAAGALGTLAALVYAAGGMDAFRAGALGFVLWALFPYGVLAVALPRFWSARARMAGLAGTAAIVVGALALYADALWLHPDAQGALAFVFVPVVQLAVAAGTPGLAWLLHRRRDAAAPTA